MAQKTIPELRLTDEVNDSDLLPMDNGIQTFSVTIGQLKNHIVGEILGSLFPKGVPVPFIGQEIPPGFISCMNVTIGGLPTAVYHGEEFREIYTMIWNMAGLSLTAGDPFRIQSARGASPDEDFDSGKLITIDFVTNEIFIRAKSASRALGSYQDSDNKAHRHTYQLSRALDVNSNSGDWIGQGQNQTVRTYNPGNKISGGGGDESRPKNTALNYIMRY